MSYSEAEKNDILRKVIKLTVSIAARGKIGFAPDILIEPALNKANELIEKYQDDPDVDIWRNARLDKYVNHIARNIMVQKCFDYELSEENLEAVNALIEAEAILGDQATDADLATFFDYTPEELDRLRLLAQYLGGIDRDACCKKFYIQYHLND